MCLTLLCILGRWPLCTNKRVELSCNCNEVVSAFCQLNRAVVVLPFCINLTVP